MITRVTGGCSLFSTNYPDLCPRKNVDLVGSCGEARVVDCCKQVADHDIVECSKCGEQKLVPCSFDEDMA